MHKAFSGNITFLLDMIQARLSEVTQECHITCMLQDRSWTPAPGGSKLCPLSPVPAFKLLVMSSDAGGPRQGQSLPSILPIAWEKPAYAIPALKSCLVEYKMYMVLLFKKINISLTFIVS